AVSKEPALASPQGSVQSIESQARSYLHANCSHCHRFGGGGGQVVLEMDFSKSLKETGLFDGTPKQGDFGLPDARVVAPGDPYRSVLYYRMLKFGRGHMPHLGSDWPDAKGTRLVGKWIESLDPAQRFADNTNTAAARAIGLAQGFHSYELPRGTEDAV